MFYCLVGQGTSPGGANDRSAVDLSVQKGRVSTAGGTVQPVGAATLMSCPQLTKRSEAAGVEG